MKEEKVCLQCGKTFSAPLHILKKRKFCGYNCYWKYRKANKMLPPSRTGTTITEKHKDILRQYRGKKRWNWNGGRRKHSAGYIQVLCPSHPFADCNGYVMEHRLVMEAHMGRVLLPTEVVHHINGIVDDNRIENLMLFVNSGKHSGFHFPKGSLIGSNKKGRS